MWGNMKETFSINSQHWVGILCHGKQEYVLSYIDSTCTMVENGLATQGARASTAMVWAYFFQEYLDLPDIIWIQELEVASNNLLGMWLLINAGIKVNSLWPNDAVWRQRPGSTLAQVTVVAWRHQAITWTNFDLPSVRSIGIHLNTILQEPPIIKISCKITFLKFLWNLPGANELNHVSKRGPSCVQICWKNSSGRYSYHGILGVEKYQIMVVFDCP